MDSQLVGSVPDFYGNNGLSIFIDGNTLAVGRFAVTPEDNSLADAVGGYHRSQVGGGVVGQTCGRPFTVAADGGYDLRAVHQQVLLRRRYVVSGILFINLGIHTDPGRHGIPAGSRNVYVAVAKADEAAGAIAGAGERCGLTVAVSAKVADMGTAVVDAAAVTIADVGQQLSVITQFRERVGVGVFLETHHAVGIVQTEQPDRFAPGAGIRLQIVPALQGGGGGYLTQTSLSRHQLRNVVQSSVGVVPIIADISSQSLKDFP